MFDQENQGTLECLLGVSSHKQEKHFDHAFFFSFTFTFTWVEMLGWEGSSDRRCKALLTYGTGITSPAGNRTQAALVRGRRATNWPPTKHLLVLVHHHYILIILYKEMNQLVII